MKKFHNKNSTTQPITKSCNKENQENDDHRQANRRRSKRGTGEIHAILGSSVGVENPPTPPCFFVLIEHLIHENLAHTVLQQRRSHPGLQVFHQALQVNPGVAQVGVELVPDGAKARPAGFGHDEGDSLVAGDSEGGDNGVDHDVEEVAVADAGDEVVAEVERIFLEERDAEGDLGVDQEAGICILQELEERTEERDPWGFLKLCGGDEGERRGHFDLADAEDAEGHVDVGDCREEVVEGFRVHVGEGVAYRDGSDFDTWIEWYYVGVEPRLCYRAVLGDLRDHVVGDGEEERGVSVEEAPAAGGHRRCAPPPGSGGWRSRWELSREEAESHEEEEAQHGCCGSAREERNNRTEN
ncbi:hypothetical protein V8G54_035960 [Vigna mungo]|uniref:Uncharacterized protein n=1 Tax=Vigna mungo TaxID=3915 RepID=A0AAQ3RDV4_VIGMU